jgi:hypothetical protein
MIGVFTSLTTIVFFYKLTTIIDGVPPAGVPRGRPRCLGPWPSADATIISGQPSDAHLTWHLAHHHAAVTSRLTRWSL